MTRISRNRHRRVKISIFRHQGVNYSVALDVPGASACRLATKGCATVSAPVRSWKQLRALYRRVLSL
jgi:hypothetical protein